MAALQDQIGRREPWDLDSQIDVSMEAPALPPLMMRDCHNPFWW